MGITDLKASGTPSSYHVASSLAGALQAVFVDTRQFADREFHRGSCTESSQLV